MANLEQIVSRKAENDTKWKEAQQAERENTTAMQDAGITEITSNPEAYARYLEMQGDNPSYSAGNIALVMFGNPEATVFGTRDRWKTLSRSIMDSEKSNGVKIFARSPMGRGYTLADAYDIKQTQGRDISRITLQNDSKEMEAALTTVLNYAVVPVVIDKELPTPAFYDAANLELARYEFEAPVLLEDDEIADILGKVDALTAWANDVKEYALQQAISGKEWSGWKLVEGRSNRKYTSEAVVATTVENAGFDPYEKKVLGVTAMQKLLGKTRFEELLAPYIEKPQGKPTLVPESDKRPAMNTAKNDFMEEF